MKTLKKFEFKEVRSFVQSIYDWDKILDGGIYKMDEGVDYKVPTSNFIFSLKKKAQAIGAEVVYNRVEGGVVVQCTAQPTDESRAQAALETKQRNAERKARKAARAAAEANGEADDNDDGNSDE